LHLRIERTNNRFPAGKLPVFLFYAFFAGYLAIHALLERSLHLCWFRTLTGINCPTCGISRAFLALSESHFVQAFLYNPLILLLALGAILQVTSTLAFKRRLALSASPKERKVLLIIFLILFALNWLYVILTLD
jgi:hypothetical protein